MAAQQCVSAAETGVIDISIVNVCWRNIAKVGKKYQWRDKR
jgi:hypothetical protein